MVFDLNSIPDKMSLNSNSKIDFVICKTQEVYLPSIVHMGVTREDVLQ